MAGETSGSTALIPQHVLYGHPCGIPCIVCIRKHVNMISKRSSKHFFGVFTYVRLAQIMLDQWKQCSMMVPDCSQREHASARIHLTDEPSVNIALLQECRQSFSWWRAVPDFMTSAINMFVLVCRHLMACVITDDIAFRLRSDKLTEWRAATASTASQSLSLPSRA